MQDTILVNQDQVRAIAGKLRGKKKDADDFFQALSKEIQSARQCFDGTSYNAYVREYNQLKSHVQKSLYTCLDKIASTMEKAAGLLIEADKKEANKISQDPVFNNSKIILGKVGSNVSPGSYAKSKNNNNFSVMGMLGKVLGPNKVYSGAVKSGKKEFHPFKDVTVTTKGDLLGYEASLKHNVGYDFKNGEVGASINAKAEGYVAKGEVEGKIGIASVTASGVALQASGAFEAKSVLFENGKLDPQLGVKASAEAVGLKGSVGEKFGNNQFNIHQSAEGAVGVAKAEASATLGKDGVGASAEVGAAVFKGEVKQGFTLFGVNFDVSAEGEALGVGAKAEFGVDKDSIDVGGKLSALAGLGLKLKVSW